MKKKHIVRLVVFAVIALCGFAAMRFFGGNDDGAPTASGGRGPGSGGPVPVEVGEISLRSMTDIRDFTGTVRPSYSYVISAKVAGRLVSLNKRIGDPVRSNELVGRIDDTEFRSSLDEAQTQVRVNHASLDEVTATLSHNQRELERTRGLVEKGIASQAELDALKTQVETQQSRLNFAKAQLEQRQVLLNQAQTRFEYTQVRASQAGLIAQRHVDGGTMMTVGAPILTVVGLDTVFVELAVTERDYQRLAPGKAAAVTVDAIPGRTFEGIVHRMAPYFQSASRTAAVEIALRNQGHLLKPGMFARISITLNEESNARSVPAAALVEREGRFSVFVVSDSATVSSVPVEVGINDGQFAQILSPPDLEGQVVTLGQHLLRNGTRVTIPGQEQDRGRAASR
ncbi:MAG: efflux RND transporter periplasmic adaptor subunit [Chitinispirillales bacterium]|jgi:RND family efflux transporter MFP subunit|nr:efflux RND transporter periplasmic adaptor subunit [Chitinispirillales bacterium]